MPPELQKQVDELTPDEEKKLSELVELSVDIAIEEKYDQVEHEEI